MKIKNKYLYILKDLENNDKYIDIVKKHNVSLGTITFIKQQGLNYKEYKINRAIIWAAGWGSRLMPITKDVPKPLVKVNGVSILQSIINSLRRSNINEIYIVLGCQKEKFEDIIKKEKLKVIYNEKWQKHNNVSSFYFFAKNYLNKGAYLIDGDILIDENFYFSNYAINSFAISTWVKNNHDIIFHKKGSFINHISFPKNRWESQTGFQYKGVFYLTKNDLTLVYKNIKNSYLVDSEYESRYWFEFFFSDEKIKLEVEENKKEDLYEIDNIDDLIKKDSSYERFKNGKKDNN